LIRTLYTKLLNNPSQYGFTDIKTSGGSFWQDVIHPKAKVHQYMAEDLQKFLLAQTPGTTPTGDPGTTVAPTTTIPEPTTTFIPPTTTDLPPTPTTTVAGPQQTHYGQCGGQGYNGPTTCESPYTCKYSNQYYSQCL